MRVLSCLLLCAIATPALATPASPYYGPMRGKAGGYKEKILPDGRWKIEAAGPSLNEIDVAMYRAAELARQGGYSFVQFLDGWANSRNLAQSVTVWARPSHDAAPPPGCPVRRCYTASVAEVLRVLGGPDGNQPGTAIVDHRDRDGLEVYVSGFGIGDVTRLAARPPLPVAATLPEPQTAMVAPLPAAVPRERLASDTRPSAAESYQALLLAAQPM